MEIVIKIPKEFEEHFNLDRFEDSLARVASDIGSFGSILAGRYEKETITMLREAFKSSTPLPKGHGRLIDESQIKHIECHTEQELCGTKIRYVKTTDAPTIIEADRGER